MTPDYEPENASIEPEPVDWVIYYDGRSSRRHLVRLAFKNELEIIEDETTLAAWPFDGIRRADHGAGALRLNCLTAPELARLEIRNAGLAAELTSRCRLLDDDVPGRHGVGAIIGWSLAAAISIIAVVWFGVPLAADRLAPLVPNAIERRVGDVAEGQITSIFGDKTCHAVSGEAAFNKLVATVSHAAGLDSPVQATVLNTALPNAFALPGGKVYLFSSLLAKAENPDEIAGVLAHEFGHVRHRDNMRNLIHNGGTSFLIGLLFGDITGSGALIFASRTLLTSSYSREAEENADAISIDVMHRLGRPTKAMGELMLRVTGKQADNGLSILSSHPLTEDRLRRMTEQDRPPSGPPLLTAEEWGALKVICNKGRDL
jgi:Zn-dependent protease with chaperone function